MELFVHVRVGGKRTATLSEVEKAKFRATLMPLTKGSLIGLLETLHLEVPTDEVEMENAAALVLAEVESGRAPMVKVVRLVEYFTHAPKIEGKSYGFSKKALGQILGFSPSAVERTTREELFRDLRSRVFEGSILPAALAAKDEVFLRVRVNKLAKPEARAYVANALLGASVQDYTPSDLTQLLLTKIQARELSEAEVIELIKKANRETKLAQRRQVEGVTNRQLADQLNQIASDVRDLKQFAKRLDDQRPQGFLREYRSDTGRDMVRLLQEFRLALSRVDDKSEERYDRLLTEFARANYPTPAFIENAQLVGALRSLEDAVRSTHFSTPIEDFFEAVRDEVARLNMHTNPPIYRVREGVTERLVMSAKEFNQALLQCRAKGWVRLIEGSPSSATEDHWLDTEGRRLYYLEIVQKE